MKKTVATFRRPIPAKALEKLTEAFKITCGDDEVFIEQRGEFFAFYTVIFPEDRGEGWKKFERVIDEAQLHVGGDYTLRIWYREEKKAEFEAALAAFEEENGKSWTHGKHGDRGSDFAALLEESGIIGEDDWDRERDE